MFGPHSYILFRTESKEATVFLSLCNEYVTVRSADDTDIIGHVH
jgi:hypothetical protein